MPYNSPEKQHEYSRKYNAIHRDEINACRRERYAEHPERANEYAHRWRAANPEKARAVARKYCATNRERVREYNRKWYAAHPEKVRAYRRRAKLRSNYALTVEEFDAMVAAQGGRCAICGEIPSGSRSVLDVDHDHATGTVRGLLCHGCNKATGFLHDNPDLLQKAINYLRRTE